MKKENNDDNNIEESEEDFEEEEEIIKSKPNFDFLKMDIFNTNLNKNKNKKEKIKINNKDERKIRRKVMRLKKIKKYNNRMNIMN